MIRKPCLLTGLSFQSKAFGWIAQASGIWRTADETTKDTKEHEGTPILATKLPRDTSCPWWFHPGVQDVEDLPHGWRLMILCRANVHGLRTFLSLLGLVFYVVAFLQGAEAARLNRRLMHKQILAAVIRSDESEAFLIVKPLHRSSCHSSPFLTLQEMLLAASVRS